MDPESEPEIAWDVWEAPTPAPSFAEEVVNAFLLHVEFERLVVHSPWPEVVPADRFAEAAVERFLALQPRKRPRPPARTTARSPRILGAIALALPLAALWFLRVGKPPRESGVTGELRGGTPPSAESIGGADASAAAGEIELQPGHLWSTVPRIDGSWGAVRDVQGELAVSGPIGSVAAALGSNGETQLLFTAQGGHLRHAVRRADGSWARIDGAEEELGVPGLVATVAGAAGANGETQFVFTTRDGRLWHALRHADGSWARLHDLKTELAIPGAVANVAAAAGANGETQFVFTTRDGHLWHTLRHASGAFAPIVNVEQGKFPAPGPVLAVAGAAGANGDTHFLFATISGHLWHALRHSNGGWAEPHDLQGELAISSHVASVAAATGGSGEISLLFTASDGHLWHTVRRANGTWDGVSALAGSGFVANVAEVSGANGETECIFITK